MKLARPDIFHPRIVLAGDPLSAGETTGRADDAGLVDALRRRGLQARSLSWDDPDVLDADLVILRAAHDQVTRSAGFLAWTRRVPNLLNHPDVVAWNAEERYLRDLEYAGVPTMPRPVRDDAVALVFFGGGNHTRSGWQVRGRPSTPTSRCGTWAARHCGRQRSDSVSGSTNCCTPEPTWSGRLTMRAW